MARHNDIGKLGEQTASVWLEKHGFSIIQRNYSKKCGEIDIVARGTDEKVHFVEVKTVSYETRYDLNKAVSHGTLRPEENVHAEKQRKLKNVIQVWLSENKYRGLWQIDILAVRLVPNEKYATVYMLDNVVFD